MAASYWHSSQYKYWKYTKPELQSIRKKLEDSERALVQQYPLPDRRLINIYINSRELTFLYLSAVKKGNL